MLNCDHIIKWSLIVNLATLGCGCSNDLIRDALFHEWFSGAVIILMQKHGLP